MDQQQIRDFNEVFYTQQETGEAIHELNSRTESDLVNYNTLADLGSKVKTLEDQHGEPIGVFDNFTLLKAQDPPCRVNIILGFTSPDDGGGGIFRWDASSTVGEVDGMQMKSDHSGTGRYLRQLNNGLKMNVMWFGAISDGSQDCTDAINAALGFLPKEGPVDKGIGTIYFPKGEYLINGTIERVASKIGLSFIGDGEHATIITRTNDSGILFNLITYMNISFVGMSFEHITTQDQSSWTNTLFHLDGISGGRNFYLNRVSSRGFNTVIFHNYTVNEDTNYVNTCTFRNCTTFLNSENAQAVINEYKNVTWSGSISQVFHVAGNWQTLVENANIVIDGTFIRYKNLENKFNSRGFTVKNTKFEFTSAHSSANDIPKIVHAVGNKILINLRMIDCSLTGGTNFHEDTRAFTIDAIPYISVEGGTIEGILDLTHSTGQLLKRAPYIRFTDTLVSNPNTWNILETGTGGRRIAPIVFNNARLLPDENAAPINLTFSRQGAPYISPRVTTALIDPTHAATNFFADTVENFKLEFYGQRVMINQLLWTYKRGQINNIGREVKIFSDSQYTNLLYTFLIPENAANDTTYIIPTANEIISTGLYVQVTTPANVNTHVGYLIADYTSV